MRSGEELRHAIEWFDDNDLELYGVQQNPTQTQWTSSPKAYAHHYIDDAALGCPMLSDVSKTHRPFVDWDKMEVLIFGEEKL